MNGKLLFTTHRITCNQRARLMSTHTRCTAGTLPAVEDCGGSDDDGVRLNVFVIFMLLLLMLLLVMRRRVPMILILLIFLLLLYLCHCHRR